MAKRMVLSLLFSLFLFALLILCAGTSIAGKGGNGGGKGGKDNTPPVVTIESPADQQTYPSSAVTVSGSVTDNVAVGSAELVVNLSAPVPLALAANGSFTSPATLEPGENTIEVTAADTSGNVSSSSVTVRHIESSPSITFTTPSDGDVIHAGHVDVRGTFEAPVKRLRMMGDLQAVPGSFSIEALPLPPGGTRDITVTGSDDDGNVYTSTILVSSTSEVEPLTLTADTTGGRTPLTVTFSLLNNTGETVTSWEIDYDGCGEYVPAPEGVDGLTHTYEREGLIAPTVRAHTAEGHIFSGYTVVSPYGEAELLSSLSLEDPIDVEVDKEGRVYILDRAGARIVVTDADFGVIATIGSPGTADGFFTDPTGIGLDQDGNIYVSDAASDKVQVFSPAFEHTATWGRSGSRRGEIDGVRGIDVEYDGSILLAVTDNGRVDRYRPHGYFEDDTGKGELIRPRDVVWTGGGDFAVSDSGSGQVHLYCTGCLHPEPWETAPPAFGAPSGLAYDMKNHWLLVADEAKNRVTFILDDKPSGTFVRHIDDLAGDGLGLSRPVAVAPGIHPVDSIYYIADSGNQRVVKVKLPDEEGNSPVDTWAAVKAALSAGDVEGALPYFSPLTMETYRLLFSGAGSQLPVIVQDMGEILPLSESRYQAVYGVLRYDDDKPFLFNVVFVRDGAGDWKILQW